MITAKKEPGRIAYSFATPHDRKADTVYVNVIRGYECTNHCRFCSRTDAIKGKPNMYEQKAGTNLFLKEAPKAEVVIEAIESRIKKPFFGLFGGTREIAFVGLGEPLTQFELVCNVASQLRARGYNGKIRIDTNGQAGIMVPPIAFGCFEVFERNPAKMLREAGITDIRISVNAASADEYNNLCRPKHEGAFESVCLFVRDCLGAGIRTSASFVVGFDDGKAKTRSAKEYAEYAVRLGVTRKNVIIREYVAPIASRDEVGGSLPIVN